MRFQTTVRHREGLHARPAVLFVNKASSFKSSVQVRNVTAPSAWVDAKSILNVLTLGVEPNHAIEVQVDGEDEAQAAAAIEALVESDFASG
ncbi:MAG: HPr family phosphocarrier protein [Chloroflexi bacterium]|nr:HPr family phosphocarrier protein [Chloroflexota bacterium]